jgi:integrase/recombinase XerD
VGRALDRAVAGRTEGPLLRNQRGVRMDRHAATLRLRHLADIGGVRIARMHRTCSGTLSSPPCSTPASTCATCRSPPAMPTPRTTMRYDRARNNLDRHPNYILAAFMASGT